MYRRGHEQGTRKQRAPVEPWWAAQEEENIRRIDAQWVSPIQPDAVTLNYPIPKGRGFQTWQELLITRVIHERLPS